MKPLVGQKTWGWSTYPAEINAIPNWFQSRMDVTISQVYGRWAPEVYTMVTNSF